MKNVNQDMGEDLNPTSNNLLLGKDRDEEQAHHNPDWPTSLLQLQGSMAEEDETHIHKHANFISSPEKWEIKQMLSAACIDKSELLDFDYETGLLSKEEDKEEDIDTIKIISITLPSVIKMYLYVYIYAFTCFG
jgi:ATP-dependent RNA helicase DHX8/PRP22